MAVLTRGALTPWREQVRPMFEGLDRRVGVVDLSDFTSHVLEKVISMPTHDRAHNDSDGVQCL